MQTHIRYSGSSLSRPAPLRLAQAVWQRFSVSLSLAVVALFWLSTKAMAAPLLQETAPGSNPEILAAFVPLLAASASVERAIEIGWNYLEWGVVRYAGWGADELKRPEYRQFKNGTSMLAAIVLGIVVINYSNMRLLAFLQPTLPTLLGNVPSMWDIILTGLLVGAGSKPAHDILGLLTRFKNFVGNSSLKQREEAGVALADYVLKLGQAEASARVDIPGMGGPGTRSVMSTEMANAKVDTYIDTVRRRLDQDYQ